jgi:hypothetical protein
MPKSPLEAAQWYATRGFYVVPIPPEEKGPQLKDWPELRLKTEDLPKYFNGAPSNLGVILGESYGTCDIDLDCPEAIAAAAEFLPVTGMIFGRKSARAAHHFYRCDPPLRTKKFLDPIIPDKDEGTLVELRCLKADGNIGLQTVVPPSVHPSGEQIEFEPGYDKEPANTDAAVLQKAVAHIAAAAMLARYWPGEGSGRNAAFIALAGALARAGWSLDEVVAFIRAIYRVLWGHKADLYRAKAEAEATYKKRKEGGHTTGRPSLTDHVDKRAVDVAFEWLGVRAAAEQAPASRVTVPRAMGMEDLMNDATITRPELLIEGILPRFGLAVIGGRPKDGKSWLACQIAIAVVTGQALGGWLRVHHAGRVQLWALEDQFALTKDKVIKLLRGACPDGLNDLKVIEELAKPVLSGGDQIIRAMLDESPAEVLILDSLFKLTGASQPQYDITQRDYDVLDRLRKIAIERRLLVIVIMHTKKGAAGGNPIENLLGTSGTTAVPDMLAELKRFRDGGKLTVVGRSVPSEDYRVDWHGGPDEWGWTISAQGEEAAGGETQDDVLAYLEAQGAANPANIANGVKKTFKAVWNALLRLQERRKVIRRTDRKWELVK